MLLDHDKLRSIEIEQRGAKGAITLNCSSREWRVARHFENKSSEDRVIAYSSYSKFTQMLTDHDSSSTDVGSIWSALRSFIAPPAWVVRRTVDNEIMNYKPA